MANEDEFEETDVLTVEEVLADLNKHIIKVSNSKESSLILKAELVNNVYPLMANVLEAVMGRVGEVENVLSEMLGATTSMVQPELADEIAEALEAGEQLALEVEKLNLDEVTKKRISFLIETYRGAASEAVAALDEVVLEDLDDEEDDLEDDSEGEESENVDSEPEEIK